MKQHDDDLGIAWRRVQDRIISSPLQWITMSRETRKRRNREWSQGETRVTCRPSRVMCQHCDSGDEVSETSTVPYFNDYAWPNEEKNQNFLSVRASILDPCSPVLNGFLLT